MSANNNTTCDKGCYLLDCVDMENTWTTQEEFDALPDDSIIISTLSLFNTRLDKFDSVPLLHTKGFLKGAYELLSQELKDRDAFCVENCYEDIKKYNVKSAENLTRLKSKPSNKYAVWRKWVFTYCLYKMWKGQVFKGNLLDKEKFKKFTEEGRPLYIMMNNENGDGCLMTTLHYYDLAYTPPQQFKSVAHD